MRTSEQTQPIPVQDPIYPAPAGSGGSQASGSNKGLLALVAVLLFLGGAVAGGLGVDALTYNQSDIEQARSEAADAAFDAGFQEGFDEASAGTSDLLREAYESGYGNGYGAGIETGSADNGKEDPREDNGKDDGRGKD